MMIFLHSFMRKTMYGVCIFPQYPKHFIYLRSFQYLKYRIPYSRALHIRYMVNKVNTTSLDMIVDLQELKKHFRTLCSKMHITIMLARAEVVISLISSALCTLSIEHIIWRQCIISQQQYIYQTSHQKKQLRKGSLIFGQK